MLGHYDYSEQLDMVCQEAHGGKCLSLGTLNKSILTSVGGEFQVL